LTTYNLRCDKLVEAVRDLELEVDAHNGNRVSIRWE
jgi:hypothetical protein